MTSDGLLAYITSPTSDAENCLNGSAFSQNVDLAFSENDVFRVQNAVAEGKWVFTARYDAATYGILRLLGMNGVSWVSLYAVLDHLVHKKWCVDNAVWRGTKRADLSTADAGNAAVFFGRMKLFKRTANCAGVLGPYCRHGELGYQADFTPMKLPVAQTLILNEARAFINASYNNVFEERQAALLGFGAALRGAGCSGAGGSGAGVAGGAGGSGAGVAGGAGGSGAGVVGGATI